MRQNITATRVREFANVQRKAPNPLLAVTGWELYRLTRKRSFWILGLIIFGVFCFFSWLLRARMGISYTDSGSEGSIVVTIGTAWGMAYNLALPLLVMFGLIVPFISAEGISLDLKRRTHELLMTTVVPTWAYLAGRFLAVLLVSFGLSIVMMVAVVITPKIFGYGVPYLWVALSLWLLMVIPAVTFLAGLSFSLATYFPRFSNAIKIGVLVSWIGITFIGTYIGPFNQRTEGAYTITDSHSISLAGLFDPTSNLMSKVIDERYRESFFNKVHNSAVIEIVTQDETNSIYNTVGQAMPDFSPWLLPHLVLVLVGVVCVTGAGLRFRRFARNFK